MSATLDQLVPGREGYTVSLCVPQCHRSDREIQAVTESSDMKDPRLSNGVPDMTISNEVILSGRFSPDDNNPFAEYMWMENEEEFNRQVVEELWEEEFIERCMQELLEEEEQWEWFIPSRDLPPSQTGTQLQDQISLLVLDSDVHADADFSVVVNSRLNPNAKEFIPGIQKHVM